MIALIVVSIFIIIIAVLLLTPMYIDIKFVYSEKTATPRIIIRYMNLKIPLVPRDKKADKGKPKKKAADSDEKKLSADTLKGYAGDFDKVKDDVFEVLNILFKKAVHINELSIYSVFGFDDPMFTGIATGAVNAFVYNMLGLISKATNLYNYNITLKPDFDKPQLMIRIQSIIKIKNVHIIVIVIKLLKIFYKIK